MLIKLRSAHKIRNLKGRVVSSQSSHLQAGFAVKESQTRTSIKEETHSILVRGSEWRAGLYPDRFCCQRITDKNLYQRGDSQHFGEGVGVGGWFVSWQVCCQRIAHKNLYQRGDSQHFGQGVRVGGWFVSWQEGSLVLGTVNEHVGGVTIGLNARHANSAVLITLLPWFVDHQGSTFHRPLHTHTHK